MKYDPDIHHRRSIRLEDFDYSTNGAYFVTVCAQNRLCLFDNPDVREMIDKWWNKIPEKFPRCELDEYVIMPNHFHGIIVINPSAKKGDHKDRPYTANFHPNRRGESCIRPGINPNESCIRPHGTQPDSIGRIIQSFKSLTTVEYTRGVKEHGWARFPKRLWQRNYYEHVIRNENELNEIRQYIRTNPENWETDKENPKFILELRGENEI